VRTWLYRIATNVPDRDPAPRPPAAAIRAGWLAEDPEAALVARPEVAWLQPLPDVLLAAEPQDPAAVVASRAGIRLALVAALQYLSARQRAVLILRDGLGGRPLRWRICWARRRPR
jgi:RNA polymerase sigma-70 factor, ECF subfamily